MDIDFNSLDTTINLQTWVVLLDFLGMGAKVHDLENYTAKAQMSKSPSKMANLTQDTEGTNVPLNYNTVVLLCNAFKTWGFSIYM